MRSEDSPTAVAAPTTFCPGIVPGVAVAELELPKVELKSPDPEVVGEAVVEPEPDPDVVAAVEVELELLAVVVGAWVVVGWQFVAGS
jgi:hypothetical protein